ncbi:MAG: carboxypeptidase-like regulatory domain-containing protein, partial [Bacteroidota bacterium]
MKNFCLFILSSILTTVFSQKKCEGVLLDSAYSQPIEFANIGIVGKGFGTVTNDKGEFNFSLPDSLANSPIKLSMIGYKSKTLSLQKLSELGKVKLSQCATNLNEVSVAVKKTKIKILGNDTKTKSMTAGFTKNKLGAELAIKLNIQKDSCESFI